MRTTNTWRMSAGLAGLAGLCGVAVAQAPPAAIPSAPAATAQPVLMPSAETLVILIRSSLLALAHANETGNYTVLRDLAAPTFQNANTAARLSAIFASLREQNVDLQIAAAVTPQLMQEPLITPQAMLVVTGFLPTQPQQINFQLSFQPVNGRWRLFGLNVQSGAPNGSPAKSASPAPGSNKAPALKTPPIKPEQK